MTQGLSANKECPAASKDQSSNTPIVYQPKDQSNPFMNLLSSASVDFIMTLIIILCFAAYFHKTGSDISIQVSQFKLDATHRDNRIDDLMKKFTEQQQELDLLTNASSDVKSQIKLIKLEATQRDRQLQDVTEKYTEQALKLDFLMEYIEIDRQSKNVSVEGSKPFGIFVRLFSGKLLYLTIKSSMLVEELKTLIQEATLQF